MNNYQRQGAISNAHVGKEFEAKAMSFFASQGVVLEPNLEIHIGIEGKQKEHAFDLGNFDQKVLVECKSHTWTKSDNVPSAKIKDWTVAMYLFYSSPNDYRKIFFVRRDYSQKHNETLSEYYLRTYEHLIPSDVEFWEYDEKTGKARGKDRIQKYCGKFISRSA